MIEIFQSTSRIYLDANIIIYFFERTDALQQKIGSIIADASESNVSLYVSDIGVAECLYGAHKAKSEILAQKYNEAFYDIAFFNLVPVDSERIITAAKLGAEKGLKLVDATHFLAAMEMSCEIFLTNDRRFQSSHNVQVLQISEL
jgi:predicted nucleic acid-binding protein